MGNIVEGRQTAGYEDSLVVFIIGMRINRWWAVHRWWPVFQAMTPMIMELYRNKNLGFLDMQMGFGLRGPVLIQYWRSFEELERYAHGEKHLKAWKDFYQKAARSKHVGIYHETYIVDAGKYETVYMNMPLHGLGRVSGVVPAVGSRETARRRLRGYQVNAGAE